MGCGRWVWNWCIDLNREEYKQTKKFIFKYDLDKTLVKLKKEKEWLKAPVAQSLQQRIFDFDSALRRVWKLGQGFPKYKSKYRDEDNTIRIPQQDKTIKPRSRSIKIPKLGWVKWFKHRALEGELRNVTIKRNGDRWWICCV